MAFASRSVTVTAVDRQATRTVISLSNGMGVEFPGTWDEFVQSLVNSFDGFEDKFVLRFALARWFARNPSGANPNQIVGKTATLNLGSTNIRDILTIS